VVDGQQRLTTLMLAFTALRDHYKATGAERFADRVHRQVLVNEFHEGYDHYRLLPTQADRDAYTACVEASPQAGGGDNIGAAYRFFRGVLLQGAEEGGEDWAATVETVLNDLLSIVEITAEQGDNVYRIFESINNTGVGLSQSDLLRNYVFMLLPTRGERVYQELWLPMQQRLGPKNLELLVWLDLVLRGNNRAKQSEIYRDQQKRLEPLKDDEEALQQQIAHLAERGGRLLRVLEPRHEPSTPLRTVLERLNAWGGQIHYPLALHLLDLVDTGRTTAEEAAEALGYVESYLVRRMICQIPTNNLNRIFRDAPKELEEDRSPAEAVRRFLSGRRRNWPTDEDLRQAVRTKPSTGAAVPSSASTCCDGWRRATDPASRWTSTGQACRWSTCCRSGHHSPGTTCWRRRPRTARPHRNCTTCWSTPWATSPCRVRTPSCPTTPSGGSRRSSTPAPCA